MGKEGWKVWHASVTLKLSLAAGASLPSSPNVSCLFLAKELRVARKPQFWTPKVPLGHQNVVLFCFCIGSVRSVTPDPTEVY